MTYADKHIVTAYSELFKSLNDSSRLELIERLTTSIKSGSEEEDFYKSYGALHSDKSAEEITREIKSNRKFREKEIGF